MFRLFLITYLIRTWPLRPLWVRRTHLRRLTRTRPVRWLLAAAPVLLLLLLLAVTTLAPPGSFTPAELWDLTGKIGIAVLTAMIGRAMLRGGHWF